MATFAIFPNRFFHHDVSTLLGVALSSQSSSLLSSYLDGALVPRSLHPAPVESFGWLSKRDPALLLRRWPLVPGFSASLRVPFALHIRLTETVRIKSRVQNIRQSTAFPRLPCSFQHTTHSKLQSSTVSSIDLSINMACLLLENT
jgi:hypothetical protein